MPWPGVWRGRAPGRADAGTIFLLSNSQQVLADHALGRSLLAGQQGGHAGLDGRPGQTTGQYRQRVAHVDHLVQARAEKVWRRHGQIPQKSLPPLTIPEGSGVPLSVKNREFMRVAGVSQGRLISYRLEFALINN